MTTNVATNLIYYTTTPTVFRSKTKPKVSAKKSLLDFRDYLHDLRKRSNSRDYSKNNSYLIGQVFRNPRTFKTEPELHQYIKTNFFLAVEAFDDLIKLIDRKEKTINARIVSKYRELIWEFIFDLKPFVELLERRTDKTFQFFQGGKTYQNTAFELFRTCEALYWYPCIDDQIIDKKAATNLNLFSLRQSLEIKFKRIFGVFALYNKDSNDLKIRHDFFPSFIAENLKLIDLPLPNINMTELLKIYEWTNYTIHNAVNPRIWHVHYAIKCCSSIFKPTQYRRNDNKEVLSIYASIKIRNSGELLDKLMCKIYETNGSKIFCFDNILQEAIIDEK